LEQKVENYNSQQGKRNALHRACIILPLTDSFEPPAGTPGHGKLSSSDKISLPHSIGAQLAIEKVEVPWHFRLINAAADPPLHLAATRTATSYTPSERDGSQVYAAPLDFRAPENYVFAPSWMLRQLRVAPYDVVFLTWVKLKVCVHVC